MIPPDSTGAWLRLGVWECWMGTLVYGALRLSARLVATASAGIVTVYDFTNCYAAPPVVQPCERIVYRTGGMNAMLNYWCALLLAGVAVWLLCELWGAVAPKPITDDFLKLLDESFGHDWRRPRTWPWTRIVWAYGFTFVGAVSAACIALVVSAALSSALPAKAPTPHVETSQRVRPIQ
jgi:hypothetical protein